VRSRSRRASPASERVYTLCCSTQREMLRTPKHESNYTAHNVQHNAPNQENAAHIMVGCVIDGPTSRHQAPKKRFARQMVTLTTGSTQRVGCSLATRVIARVSNKRSPPSPGAVPVPVLHSRCITTCTSLLFSLLRVHDLISAPLTTHGDSTIQKLRYADPRNRTKIEKFSQKGECFLLSPKL